VTRHDFLTSAGAFSHVGDREWRYKPTSTRPARANHDRSGIDRHIDRVAFVEMCFACNRHRQPEYEAVAHLETWVSWPSIDTERARTRGMATFHQRGE
jgi:hypothetical protein